MFVASAWCLLSISRSYMLSCATVPQKKSYGTVHPIISCKRGGYVLANVLHHQGYGASSSLGNDRDQYGNTCKYVFPSHPFIGHQSTKPPSTVSLPLLRPVAIKLLHGLFRTQPRNGTEQHVAPDGWAHLEWLRRMASITKSTGVTSTGRNQTTIEEVELVAPYSLNKEASRGVQGNLGDVTSGDQCRKSAVGQAVAIDHSFREETSYGRSNAV